MRRVQNMRLKRLLHDERGQAHFENFRSREDADFLRLYRATRATDCVSSEAQKLKPSDYLCSTAPFEISSRGGFVLMLGTIPAPLPFFSNKASRSFHQEPENPNFLPPSQDDRIVPGRTPWRLELWHGNYCLLQPLAHHVEPT